MSLAFANSIVTQVADFEHAVAQIPDSLLFDATGIVLRVDAQLWLGFSMDAGGEAGAMAEQAKAVARRAPRIDVFLVPDGHSCASASPAYTARNGPHLLVSGEAGPCALRAVSDEMTHRIRQCELEGFISNSSHRCVVRASPRYHFLLPSGAHASQFLRLAEAFVDIETVDRMAYWVALEIQSRIQPLQEGKPHALLVDHASMLVLAARVQRLVSVSLEIVVLPGYPSDIEANTRSIELLDGLNSRCSHLFLLVGVASTGRLERFVSQWASGREGVELVSTVLYSVQDIPGVSALCRLNLPGYRHFSSGDTCTLCSQESIAVPVRASNLLVVDEAPSTVALRQDKFEEQRSFLDRWGSHPGVLRVHYNDPNESTARHHAFYVDVGTLLLLPTFRAELLSALSELSPTPDVVVVPDHPTAVALGDIVVQAYRLPICKLGPVLDTDGAMLALAELREATCILVLDDVFITGTRLDSINRFLRENRALVAPNVTNLHYWTVLATPRSEANYQARRRGLTGNHSWSAQLSHFAKFVLPNWHQPSECPWCSEGKILARIAQAMGELDGPLAERLSAISDVVSGVTSAPFFIPSSDPLPNLGAESVVLSAGASPMQVLFACASAVQQLREASDAGLNPDHFPVPALLAERVFSSNYSERLIWLGLLRGLRGREMEPALKNFLRRCALDLTESARAIISGEFAIAWLLGKLGSIEGASMSRRFFEEVGFAWDALATVGAVDVEQEPSSESRA